jgi:hypothetical protein
LGWWSAVGGGRPARIGRTPAGGNGGSGGAVGLGGDEVIEGQRKSDAAQICQRGGIAVAERVLHSARHDRGGDVGEQPRRGDGPSVTFSTLVWTIVVTHSWSRLWGGAR